MACSVCMGRGQGEGSKVCGIGGGYMGGGEACRQGDPGRGQVRRAAGRTGSTVVGSNRSWWPIKHGRMRGGGIAGDSGSKAYVEIKAIIWTVEGFPVGWGRLNDLVGTEHNGGKHR